MVSDQKLTCALLALLVLALVHSTQASIQNVEPVKVTHRNSGPRYDIDTVERTRLSPESSGSPADSMQMARPQSPPSMESSNNDNNNEDDQSEPQVGHVSIRRIFLVPMMAPQAQDSSPMDGLWTRSSQDSEVAREQPSLFGGANKPFWPFLPPTRHHIFGADAASRSPTPMDEVESTRDNSFAGGRPNEQPVEREDSPALEQRPQQPFIDPIQMMVELMHQALNSGHSINSPAGNFFNDLNKEASGDPQTKPKQQASQPSSELDSSSSSPKRQSNNETREDVIEIDGKKYLRKTLINRHVGENIIFMTKRLIFIPLNETTNSEGTDSVPTTTTTYTSTPVDDSPSTVAPASTTTTSTTTTTTSTTTAAEEPSSTASPTTEQSATPEATTNTPTTGWSSVPSSTTESTREETTTTTANGPKETWADRVSEAIERTAERLVERERASSATTTTTTAKPASESPQV